MLISAIVLAAGVAAATCTPTIPNGSQPPADLLNSPAFGGGGAAVARRAGPTKPNPHFHGNGAVWTSLPLDGRFVVRRSEVTADGSIGLKMPWWMARSGDLTVSARGLDAAAPAAKASVGNSDEPRFRPSSVFFSAPGCWEVTARTRGSAPLTFVIDLQVGDP